MIYDGHAYCFPPPGRNGGFANPAEFWQHLQLFMAQARQQPCWRRADRAPADATGLYDPDRPWALRWPARRRLPHRRPRPR